jgi:hypothetical protein
MLGVINEGHSWTQDNSGGELEPAQGLNQTTKEWHTRAVTLSETKSLVVRFFSEFILSEAE